MIFWIFLEFVVFFESEQFWLRKNKINILLARSDLNSLTHTIDLKIRNRLHFTRMSIQITKNQPNPHQFIHFSTNFIIFKIDRATKHINFQAQYFNVL